MTGVIYVRVGAVNVAVDTEEDFHKLKAHLAAERARVQELEAGNAKFHDQATNAWAEADAAKAQRDRALQALFAVMSYVEAEHPVPHNTRHYANAALEAAHDA